MRPKNQTPGQPLWWKAEVRYHGRMVAYSPKFGSEHTTVQWGSALRRKYYPAQRRYIQTTITPYWG